MTWKKQATTVTSQQLKDFGLWPPKKLTSNDKHEERFGRFGRWCSFSHEFFWCSFWRKYQNTWEVEWKRWYHRSYNDKGLGFPCTDTIIVKGHLTGWEYLIKTLWMRDTFHTWLDMLIQRSNLTTEYITIPWRTYILKIYEEKKNHENHSNQPKTMIIMQIIC